MTQIKEFRSLIEALGDGPYPFPNAAVDLIRFIRENQAALEVGLDGGRELVDASVDFVQFHCGSADWYSDQARALRRRLVHAVSVWHKDQSLKIERSVPPRGGSAVSSPRDTSTLLVLQRLLIAGCLLAYLLKNEQKREDHFFQILLNDFLVQWDAAVDAASKILYEDQS